MERLLLANPKSPAERSLQSRCRAVRKLCGMTNRSKRPLEGADKERGFGLAPSGQYVACQGRCGMPALWLQAGGVCRGQKLDLSAMRPLLFSVCAETRPETACKRRSAHAGEFVHLSPV